MLFITVKSEDTETINWNDKKTGEAKSFTNQKAYAHVPGEDFPVPCPLRIEHGQAPYAVGEYVLDGASYRYTRGRVEINPFDLHVIPVQNAIEAMKNWLSLHQPKKYAA